VESPVEGVVLVKNTKTEFGKEWALVTGRWALGAGRWARGESEYLAQRRKGAEKAGQKLTAYS
jgi:hypothetical protein